MVNMVKTYQREISTSNHLALVSDDDMRLHLLELSKTEVGQCFDGWKISPEAKSLQSRCDFVQRQNKTRLVALTSSSKALQCRLAHELRQVMVAV
ncbi:hypothetical protein PanWU01x14_211020 [Parasponia andersonii]|uniref:Uncharacterized protein n=1 Tax=Parasponia andersonii TaxID=3476 RepID=A0A2P5BU07_PARAD|nr:hypothetical protein PanWU01x14_211020 [Parasponia andersonii]